MHVLQAPVAIVGRQEAEVGPHSLAPGLGKIFDPQAALEHLQLEVEAQHDVEIVSDLVRIGANAASARPC